jgi:riboflavin synthase
MFTGIVEELGTVRGIDVDTGGLSVACSTVTTDAVVGASIAVSGCCLTVVELDDGGFAADLAPETLARTTLGGLAPGDAVNLERPLRLQDRLGGHLVQGHVDGVGRVSGRADDGHGSVRLSVEAPDTLLGQVVEKGSVTVDGVSLTVTAVTDDAFSVALIPHTLATTTLGRRAPGDPVNLEGDVVAKYVQRLLEPLGQAALRR